MTYHSPRPGRHATAPSRPPAAEPPAAPSSASSSASASSPSPSASPAMGLTARHLPPRARASPIAPGNLRRRRRVPLGASHGTPSSAPSGTPLPRARLRGHLAFSEESPRRRKAEARGGRTSGAPRGRRESRESPPMTPGGNPVKRKRRYEPRASTDAAERSVAATSATSSTFFLRASLAPAARVRRACCSKRTEPADAEASVARSEKTLNSKDPRLSKTRRRYTSELFGPPRTPSWLTTCSSRPPTAARRADEIGRRPRRATRRRTRSARGG